MDYCEEIIMNDKFIDALKILPAVGGIGVGINNLNYK